MTATASAPAAPTSSLLTASQIAAQLGICVRAFQRMVATGEFPQPLRRNRKWVRWYASDLDNYLRKLDQARSA